MSVTNNISPASLDVLTSQLPLPPPSVQPQQPERVGFLGSFGVTALNVAEGLGKFAAKIQRFTQTIFDEIFNCTFNAKALVTDVFSSFERVEAAIGRNTFLDPMASVSRAWSAAATPAQGPAEAQGEPSAPLPQEAAKPQESPLTRYRANFLTKIEVVERKAATIRDMALKIITELGARFAALKSFVTIGLNGLKEIERVFQAQPLSSPELTPLLDQISQLFKNVVGKSTGDAAKAV